MKNLKMLEPISVVLVLFGAILLGFKGVFGVEPVSHMFDHKHDMAGITRLVYVLIGLSGVYRIGRWLKHRA
jgi:uncharacterized membrane protein YuzA (DUF378 family)